MKLFSKQIRWEALLIGMLGLAACNSPSSPTPQPKTTDTTPPTVVSVQPVDAATEVSVDTVLVVTFSEAIEPSSLALNLDPKVELGNAAWNSDNTQVSFASSNLAVDTAYTFTISAKDLAGNSLSGQSGFGFRTALTPDTPAPKIILSQPAPNATEVATATNLQFQFSKPMNPDSVRVQLDPLVTKKSKGSNPVLAMGTPSVTLGTPVWKQGNTRLEFDPPSDLTTDTTYYLSISGKDVVGNDLSGQTSFSFKTVAMPDTTAPTLVSSQPADGSTGNAVNSNLLITFSEAMSPDSLRVSVDPSTNLGAPIWKSDNHAVEFGPSTDLLGDTVYTLSISGKDTSGNALPDKTIGFKTAAIRDTAAPATPLNLRATAGEGQVQVQWDANSEPDLKGYNLFYGTAVGNLNNSVFIGKPTTNKTVTGLTNGTTYFFSIDAEDAAGNRSSRSNNVSTTPKDVTPPRLVSSIPVNGAKKVSANTEIELNFSEPMDMSANDSWNYISVTCHLVEPGECSSLTGLGQTGLDTGLILTLSSTSGLDLGSNGEYTIDLLGMRDKAGNLLPRTTLRFSVADSTPPEVLSALPEDNAVGLPLSTTIDLSFSEPMDTHSVESQFFAQYVGGSFIAGTFIWSDGNKAVSFKPNAPIGVGGLIEWYLGTYAKDLVGNNISATVNRHFRVARQTTITLPNFLSGHILVACGREDIDGPTCEATKYFNEAVMRVGDRAKASGSLPYEASRGIMTFRLGPTRPVNSTVVAARLRVSRVGIAGDPLTNLGSLYIDKAGSQENPDIFPSRTLKFDFFRLGQKPYDGIPIYTTNIDQDVSRLVSGSNDLKTEFVNLHLLFATVYANNNRADYFDFSKAATLTVTYQYP